MKTLPSVLVREKNKLFTPDPWIVLLGEEDVHAHGSENPHRKLVEVERSLPLHQVVS